MLQFKKFPGEARNRRARLLAWAVIVVLSSSSCDRLITPRQKQLIKDAETKTADGNFLRAINLYEAALDDSDRSADIHYRLALLYDDKMNDPLNALHHFKRYLTLAPGGSRAREVKEFLKRDELALVTSLSGDSVISRKEVASLKNENLRLQREIEERSPSARRAGSSEKAQTGERVEKALPVKKSDLRPRQHVVEAGDTLASISRKFYKTSSRWKEILDANHKIIEDPEKLKIGQTLSIP